MNILDINECFRLESYNLCIESYIKNRTLLMYIPSSQVFSKSYINSYNVYYILLYFIFILLRLLQYYCNKYIVFIGICALNIFMYFL